MNLQDGCKLTWMEMEENVEQALVTPSDVVLVGVVEWQNLFDKLELSHPGEVHEHDARVEAQSTVVGVPSESVVPAHIGFFMFRRQSCQMCAVEQLEMAPDRFEFVDEQDVGVDVQQRVDCLEDFWEEDSL